MIHYLHIMGEFWLYSAAKVVEWVSKTLFLKNVFSGGSRRRRRRMALTKRRFVMKSKNRFELGLRSLSFTRGVGRKRILLSSRVRESLSRSAVEIPITESPPVKSSLKRERSRTIIVSSSSDKSRLESLPQELLIRVICGVDHEDLKSLNIVSKLIREASLIAKELHFAYTTPRKIRAFRNQVEPPNAPVHHRWTKAKRKEQLSNVSVALFT